MILGKPRFYFILVVIAATSMPCLQSQDDISPQTASQSDSSLLIEKTPIDFEGNGFFANDPLLIKVEISSLNQSLKNLEILESIDHHITITSHSHEYADSTSSIPSGLPQNWNGLSDLASDCPMSGDDFQFRKPDLNPGERIIYVYRAIPTKSGIYLTKTEATYEGDKGSKELDLTLPLSIMDKNPLFQLVSINPKKTVAECEEKIPISYSLRYLGGDNCSLCNHIVNIDNSNDYSIDNTKFRVDFTKGEIKTLETSIRYHNAGSFTVPGLKISGRNYEPQELVTITITSPISKYLNTTTISLFSLLIALISIIFNIYSWIQSRNKDENKFKYIEDQIEIIFSKFDAIEVNSKSTKKNKKLKKETDDNAKI
jgi:hypothetical protein